MDHNYLLSDRHACSIMKISRSTGQLLWRLGGPANAFKFIGEHEENAPLYFAAQHSVLSLPNGNLLFFDNGGDVVNLYIAGVERSIATFLLASCFLALTSCFGSRPSCRRWRGGRG